MAGELGQEVGREEGVLVLGDAPVHSGVDHTLKVEENVFYCFLHFFQPK
jgi:hypothetical protein